MKKLLLPLLILICFTSYSQTTGYLRYDSVKVMKQNGNSTLIIENATRDTLGFLYNYGDGRTRFDRIRAVEGGIKVGDDTVLISGGLFGRTDIRNNSGGLASFNAAGHGFTIDSLNYISFYTPFDFPTFGAFYMGSDATNWRIRNDGAGIDSTGIEIQSINDKGKVEILADDSLIFRSNRGLVKFFGLIEGEGTKTIRYDPTTNLITYHDIPTGGGGGPGGISEVIAGFGLLNINDSTLAVDTADADLKDWAHSGVYTSIRAIDDTTFAIVRYDTTEDTVVIRGSTDVTLPADVVYEDSVQTLTNKRWVPRVGSTTSSATPTINTDNYDIYKLTAQTADITSFTTNLTGTAVDGDILEIQITGTAARAITWGASFVASTVNLPSTTVTTATLTTVFQYFTTSSYGNNKWVCVNSF